MPPLPRRHDEPLTPRQYGHSIGWYEDSTLVIDTVGFSAGVLASDPGIFHSDALHMVERITVDPEESSLKVAWTGEHPLFFTRPYSGSTHLVPSPYAVIEWAVRRNARFVSRNFTTPKTGLSLPSH